MVKITEFKTFEPANFWLPPLSNTTTNTCIAHHCYHICCVFYSSTLTIFHTEINICSPLKLKNLRIFGFVINFSHDWIVHTTQARQTNSMDCDMNITKVLRRLGTDLHYSKNVIRTKVILKIYTHTTYFTYSIANLRKRLSRAHIFFID